MIRRVSRTHYIPLDRRTLHGHFSRDLEPVIAVDPGDSVEFQALDAGWHWDLVGEWLDNREPELDDGHPLAGPIEVRGARAGQTLVVRIDEVRPRDWGITFAGEDSVVWRLGEGTGTTADGDATVALAPFLGVIGMPPAEPGVHSTTPPRSCRLRSTEHWCRPATAMRRRATVRCPAPRSSARWRWHA